MISELNREFQYVKDLKDFGQDKLTIKLPGLDIELPIQVTKAYINPSLGIGYLKLAIQDYVLKPYDDPLLKATNEHQEFALQRINDFKRLLSNPKITREYPSEVDHYLFYSKTPRSSEQRLEILTIPEAFGNNEINEEHPGLVIARYGLEGRLSGIRERYTLHQKAINGNSLITKKETIIESLKGLIKKVNQIYLEDLKISKAKFLELESKPL